MLGKPFDRGKTTDALAPFAPIGKLKGDGTGLGREGPPDGAGGGGVPCGRAWPDDAKARQPTIELRIVLTITIFAVWRNQEPRSVYLRGVTCYINETGDRF